MSDLFDDVTDVTDTVLQPLGFAKGDQEKAYQQELAAYNALQAPELRGVSPSEINYGKYLTQQGPTELAKAGGAAKTAQMNALQKLGEIADQGGLTAADRARLEQIKQQEMIAEKGQREAIQQNAQARGVGGSGLELASLLGSEQGSASRAAQRDLGVADLAQQRALNAIQAGGALAGNIRGQDYQAAQAQDLINQFNTDYLNRAGLATGQGRLAARQYNRQVLPQQNFENQIRRQQLISGAAEGKGAAADARRGQAWNTIGQVALMGAGMLPMGGKGGFTTPSLSPESFLNVAPPIEEPQFGYQTPSYGFKQ